MRRTGCALIIALACTAQLAAQESKPAVAVSWHAYAQVQFNTTNVDEERLGDPEADIAASTFDTRRVRLGADAEIGEWITGKVEADFAQARLKLTDVWMSFELAEGVALRAGQFKKPFSMLELTSSSRILPIERGVSIREVAAAIEADLESAPDRVPRFGDAVLLGEHYQMLAALGYLSRDLGASVHGRRGSLGYELGVFNGAGADRRDTNDAKSVAGRITLRPSPAVPLVLGGAASHRETIADGEDVSGTVFELDAEWGAARDPGIHVQLEGAAGDNLIDGSLRSAQAVLGWFKLLSGRAEGIEPLFRLSWGDPRTSVEGDEAWFITPGLNLYFHGRNRLMVNWEQYLPSAEGAASVSGVRAQAQLYF